MSGFFTMACFVLFVFYAVFMYVESQSEVIRLAYFIASGMPTDILSGADTWVSVALGTLLCTIPSLLLLMSLRFSCQTKAMAFIPSYVLLGLFTGIAPTSTTSVINNIPLTRFIILIILSFSGIILSRMLHDAKKEQPPFLYSLWTNVLISCVGMVMCISLTCTDRQLHQQLKLANALQRCDYATIDCSMKGENNSNNTITAIQALSLSRRGILANKLFSLNGLCGSESLMPDSVPSTLLFHTHSLLYAHLQAIPVGHFSSTAVFLHKALERRIEYLGQEGATAKDSLMAKPLIDYYLCALLLDRDLGRFSSELPRFYKDGTMLPRYYREAIAMTHTGDSIYGAYLSLRQRLIDDPAVQRKECYRQFPSTYWNYYHFGPECKH